MFDIQRLDYLVHLLRAGQMICSRNGYVSIPLETSIRERLEQLVHLSDSCFIYRVPETIRCLNPDVYTPKVVSIGPLHHGKKSLRDMEEHKYRYLQQFLHHTGEALEYLQLCWTFFRDELQEVGVDYNLERLNSSNVKGAHFLDVVRNLCLPPEPLVGKPRNATATLAPSITELHQAGVKLKVGTTRNLFGIRFNNQMLEIPNLTISHRLENTMRNLAAFEQCHYWNYRIADYLELMDCFVNAPKDVELLAEYGIITNFLGDSNEACELIKSLCKRIFTNRNDFCFSRLTEEPHSHCRKPWNKWKANLRQNYLNTPWAIVSVVAAGFLIILTAIQTVCSLISLS